MHYNLKSVRESYGKTKEEFAALLGKSVPCYEIFEIEQEIPCKYIYMLWKLLPDFPIPDDFFHYTSFTLEINMKYRKLKQEDIAKMFNIRQATVSSYFIGDPIPMYELKDIFLANFNPLVVPCVPCKEGNEVKIREIQELNCRGNFVTNKRKRAYKKIRSTSGMTTEEHRQQRVKQREEMLKAVANG